MQVGNKAIKHNDLKQVCPRHGRHISKRSQNAIGKALRTKVRREGKLICQEND